jgi:hypothetical protein
MADAINYGQTEKEIGRKTNGGAPGWVPRRHEQMLDQRPAARRSCSTRSVRSQEKSGSVRPKWPNAAVWE